MLNRSRLTPSLRPKEWGKVTRSKRTIPVDTFEDFMKVKPQGRPVWKWVEGVVDTNEDHIKLWYELA